MRPLRCFMCGEAWLVTDRVHPKVYVHDCPQCKATFATLVVTAEDGKSRELKMIGELLDIEPKRRPAPPPSPPTPGE